MTSDNENVENETDYPLELPHSGGRYFVAESGTVITDVGVELPYETGDDGELKVWLEWVLGGRWYSAGFVVLMAHSRLVIASKLLREIQPLYTDGDKTNLSIDNLAYRFINGPIEVTGYPGYHYIPMQAQYGISRDGVAINVMTGKVMSWSVTKPNPKRNRTGGYYYTRISRDDGFSTCLFRHRALCLTYKSYPDNVRKLQVNHEDGVPGNDNLDNINWSTPRENVMHAISTGLMGTRHRTVLVRNYRDGSVQEYPSIQAVSVATNLPRNVVRWRLNNGHEERLYPDYLMFKYKTDGIIWPDIEVSDKNLYLGSEYIRNVIARNVFTGDSIVYSNGLECAKSLKIQAGNILRHCHDHVDMPIYGYNFRYFDEVNEHPFPGFTDKHLRIFKDHPRRTHDGIDVTNIETNETTFYTSRDTVAKLFETTPAYIHSLAQSGKIYKNHTFNIFKVRENLVRLGE